MGSEAKIRTMAWGVDEPSPSGLHWTSLSRRRFLQLLVATGVVGVVGCDTSPRPTAAPTGAVTPEPTPIGDVPFGVWEAMRDAIRGSPDHLTAAADRAVATGDAAAIFAFVRDQIATFPPRSNGFTGAETDTRWGARGTLRGGGGTPREKADLLAELYQRAGLTAEVVVGRFQAAHAARRDILFRVIEHAFDPAVDDATLAAWDALISEGSEPTPPLEFIDADGAESDRLAGALVPLLPADAAAEPFDWGTLENVPLVKVEVGGAARFANPLLPDGAFGEHYCDATPRRAAAAIPGRPVTLELQIATSDDPNKRTTIAQGTWAPADLVGRQLGIQFAPAGDIGALLLTPLDQIRTFTPVLSLRGSDVPPELAAETAVVGTTVTVEGDIFEEAEDGAVVINGVPLAPGPSDPSGGVAVTSVEVTVRPDAFPVVRLRVSVLDASGKAVSGLPPEALTLQEDGVRLGFVLHANEPPPQRVLLLFDTSDSIPAAFRGAAAVELGRQLATELVAAHPTLQLRAAAIDAGLAAAKGNWTRDPDALAAGVSALTGFGSDMWTALVDARKQAPTVIVLISDGQATDRAELIAINRPKVAAGVPVVAIGVGDVDAATMTTIASLTGGTSTTVAERAEAVSAVRGYVGVREAQPYDLTYRAPAEGASTRTINLTVGPAASATATYDVPVEEERVPAPALVGLYLSVGQGSRRVLRTLAGIDANRPLGFREVVPPAAIEEVRGALFGSALLSIEGAAPTAAAWFDDFLAARPSLRALWTATEGTDLVRIADALQGGIVTIPPVLMALHAPLPGAADDRSLTFETGLRAVLYVEQPRLGVGIVQRADILPLADWTTVTDDPREAYRLTLTRTARLAVAEAALFETSAAARLVGRPLTAVAARKPTPSGEPLAEWSRLLEAYRDDHRFVPSDTGPFAMWAASSESGRLLGILPDGSGGGQTAYEKTVDAAERLLALLSLLGSMYGAGFAFSAFLALQKAILKQIVRQAIMVAAIGTEECIDPRFNEVLKDLACDLAKSALPKLFKELGEASKLDKWSKVATGKNLKCPKLPVECI